MRMSKKWTTESYVFTNPPFWYSMNIVMHLNDASKIHCIGIGGIGISAIAKLLVAQGKRVSGSDAVDSEIVREAREAGVQVAVGNAAQNVRDAEVVIYSEAVPIDNAERVAARERGILELSGAEALAELTDGKRLIAVAGTNGKSTTTALVGLLLEAGGFDPTVIVGSKVKRFPLGNVRVGASEWFVLEADEYQAKFLHLKPEIAVVTNIEEDHLDYYRDLAHIRETFEAFLARVRDGGRIFLNTDQPPPLRGGGGSYVSYGFDEKADYTARDLKVYEGRQRFSVIHHEKRIGDFSIRVPGKFNVYNALAALAVALELGVSVDACQSVLESFAGIWRRFEMVGKRDGALIISDYGHHPTAIRETLVGARAFYPNRRLVLVFQPHHHHRTKALFGDFVKSFALADVLVIPEIYAVRGREKNVDEVSSQDLVAAVHKEGTPHEVYYGGSLDETERLITSLIKKGDIVIFMGAGDIDALARRVVS